MKANILDSQIVRLEYASDQEGQEPKHLSVYAKADGLHVRDDDGSDRRVALADTAKVAIVPAGLTKALDELVPGAEYNGRLSGFTKNHYDAIDWKDQRPKPAYEAVLEAADRDMRSKLRNLINARTAEIIENDFVYSGINFRLDLRHQMLYHNLWEMRTRLTYPCTVKGAGDDYLQLTEEELGDFVFAGLAHVQRSLQDGWSLKAALSAKAYPFRTYSDLLSWKDQR